MARSRLIHPGANKNEPLSDLGVDTQFTWATLPCYADREGRLHDRPRTIRSDIFPHKPDVDMETILTGLCDSGFIFRYEVDGEKYIQIDNWDKYQSIHHRETKSEIPAMQQLLKHGRSMDEARPNHDRSLAEAPEVEVEVEAEVEVTKKRVIREADKRPPITRFDEWLDKNGEFIREAALAALDETEYTAVVSRWVHNEKRKARAWIIREPKKGDKTHWGRFFGGWLARNSDSMTGEDEEAMRQANQQIRGVSDAIPLKDILAKAQKESE